MAGAGGCPCLGLIPWAEASLYPSLGAVLGGAVFGKAVQRPLCPGLPIVDINKLVIAVLIG